MKIFRLPQSACTKSLTVRNLETSPMFVFFFKCLRRFSSRSLGRYHFWGFFWECTHGSCKGSEMEEFELQGGLFIEEADPEEALAVL